MTKNVHTEHCCREHGCKYGDDYCPVEFGNQKQSYPCEMCDDSESSVDVNPSLGEWEEFLSGHWTREKPTKFGDYPVCGVGCEDSPHYGETRLVAELNGKPFYPREWNGWWWSKPMPRRLGLPSPLDAKNA